MENIKINLDEAIKIADILFYSRKTIIGEEAIYSGYNTEKLILDYAIELTVKNIIEVKKNPEVKKNTDVLTQVEYIYSNLHKDSFCEKLAKRAMVLTSDQISQVYSEIMMFAHMLRKKGRYVGLEVIGLDDRLYNILSNAKYVTPYNLVQSGQCLTEAKLEKLLSQYPSRVAKRLKEKFNKKMKELGFEWMEVEIAGKQYNKLAYVRKEDDYVEVNTTKFVTKLLRSAKNKLKLTQPTGLIGERANVNNNNNNSNVEEVVEEVSDVKSV